MDIATATKMYKDYVESGEIRKVSRACRKCEIGVANPCFEERDLGKIAVLLKCPQKIFPAGKSARTNAARQLDEAKSAHANSGEAAHEQSEEEMETGAISKLRSAYSKL